MPQWIDNKCNGTDGWTGPLACLSLSSVSCVDKGQLPRSGIWPLPVLFFPNDWKDEELKSFIRMYKLLIKLMSLFICLSKMKKSDQYCLSLQTNHSFESICKPQMLSVWIQTFQYWSSFNGWFNAFLLWPSLKWFLTKNLV